VADPLISAFVNILTLKAVAREAILTLALSPTL